MPPGLLLPFRVDGAHRVPPRQVLSTANAATFEDCAPVSDPSVFDFSASLVTIGDSTVQRAIAEKAPFVPVTISLDQGARALRAALDAASTALTTTWSQLTTTWSRSDPKREMQNRFGSIQQSHIMHRDTHRSI